MAASRKKRGISHDVMTRSEEVREEQWKYKRPGGDKSFSPSVFSPSARIRKKQCSRHSAWRITESPTESIDFSTLRNCLDSRL